MNEMIHRKRLHILTFLLLIASNQTHGQSNEKEKEAVRRSRLDKVEFYHTGVGIEMGAIHNFVFGPLVYAGIGSYRNLINADIGLKLLWTNPVGSSSKERISHLNLPVFASVSLNLLRWQQGCTYLRGEFDYHLFLAARHHLPDDGGKYFDKDLSHGYASTSLRLGVRLRNWDIHAFYEWDLAPSFDQKYVYESPYYDYENLRNALFDRSRFGLSASYIIPF